MSKATQKMVRAIMGPLPQIYGTQTVQRLMGFHACWHLMGGRQGLLDAGWDRVNLWKSIKDFQRVFGADVDDAFPEIAAVLRTLR